jgi:hypothetical protein
MNPYEMNPEEMLEAARRHRALGDALELMHDEERDVITALWGIERDRESEDDVAKRCGIDQSDVLQIAAIAKERIRSHVHLGRAPSRRVARHVPRPVDSLRRALDALDTRVSTRGFLYVIEFSTGLVKVGRSAQPHARIRSHETSAACHGVRIERQWISEEHSNMEGSESKLIWSCERGSDGRAVTGREYFRLPFAEVVSAAKEAIEEAQMCRDSSVRAMLGIDPRMQFRGFSSGGSR